MDAIRDMRHSLRASPLFSSILLLTLLAAGFNGLMVFLMILEVDLPGAFGQMTHFQEPEHRIHDLTFGFLFIPAIVGILAQFRRPLGNVAGQVMALIPTVSLLLVLLITALAGNVRVLQPPWVTVGAAGLLAMALHPAGRDFFRSFRLSRAHRMIVALVVIAAVSFLLFAATNIGLQVSATDHHSAAGHYGFMAAFGITVIGVGLLASLRPDGWRLTAWVAGLLPALLGLVSLIYPITSSFSRPWALAATAWGAVFVITAERTLHAEGPSTVGAGRNSNHADQRPG